MLLYIIATLTVGVVALRPASSRAAALAFAVAAADTPLTGVNSLLAVGKAVAPLVVVLSTGLLLARLAIARGFVDGTCQRLLALANGSSQRLYLLVCALAALLTATVTLDGAIVLMAPIVLRFQPSRPLLLGSVATVNTFSVALPEGNPTNLVVLQHLRLPLLETLERTLPAGVLATVICMAIVAIVERRSLATPARLLQGGGPAGVGFSALVTATAQVSALLLVLLPIAPSTQVSHGGAVALLVVGLVTAAVAATVNNLPASAMVAATVTGTAAYSALAGLSIGALATSQGSVATILAGKDGYTRWFAPAAFLAVGLACLVIASV